MAASGKKKDSAAAARLAEIDRRLLAAHGPQKCFLVHETPFQLLVATILSAQCTDERVNLVTEQLFLHYNTPEKMVTLSQEGLEQKIFSVMNLRKRKNPVKSGNSAEKLICKRGSLLTL